jgi:hypothetical protein
LLTNKIIQAFAGTFVKPHKATLKPSFAKEPPSTKPTHKDRHEIKTNKHDRKEGQLVTAVLQKSRISG